MNRRVVAALAVVAVLGAGFAGVAAAGAEGSPYEPVIIVESTVEPAQPTIEENFTVDTTITNLDEGTYYVERTVLRENASTDSELYGENETRVEVVGNETLHHELSADIDQTGRKSLALHVYIRTDTGDQLHVTHPINVTLRNPHPDIGATAGTRQPDGETSMNVTVANGLNESVRSLSLDLSAASADIKQTSHVKASLSPGGAWQIPVTASNVTVGTETVTATLSYTTTDGEYRRITRELTTVVDEPSVLRPELGVEADSVGPNGETTLNVTVANGLNESIRSLSLDLSAASADIEQNAHVKASLSPGGTWRVPVTASNVTAGTETVRAALSYTTADGESRRVMRELTAVVEEPSAVQPELNLQADRVGPSGETTLNVTVANALNQSIRTLAVELDAPAVTLEENREVRSKLASGETATLGFPTGSVEPGTKNVTVTLTYTTAEGTERELVRDLTARLRPVRNPGNVSLTGLQVRPRGGRLTVRGTVSNGGTTDVTGVKLAVVGGERVGPARAESTYFVGNVSASDFTSFQVNAALRQPTNQTVTIPVRVSYVVDGVRKQRVIGVEYRPRPQPTKKPPQQRGGGGLPVGLIGGGVVVVGGLLGIRRFRG